MTIQSRIQSRRTFLQTLSLGTSAFLVSDKSLSFLHEGKKLGVALVGLGNYSIRQSAKAGKHVICEKPMAMNVKNATI